jgi:exopolysaccharide biosynthesis WecB/TagA/CpsF family protein
MRRTSADMCIPQLLEIVPDATIALIGGPPGVAEMAGSRLNNVVFTADGYRGLSTVLSDPSGLRESLPNIVVLGLGASLQDRVLVQLRGLIPEATFITAGGWLDQLAGRDLYFPPWVHAIRMGWMLRLIREPRRLLRRYTLEAFKATQMSSMLVRRLVHVSEPGGTGVSLHGRVNTTGGDEFSTPANALLCREQSEKL